MTYRIQRTNEILVVNFCGGGCGAAAVGAESGTHADASTLGGESTYTHLCFSLAAAPSSLLVFVCVHSRKPVAEQTCGGFEIRASEQPERGQNQTRAGPSLPSLARTLASFSGGGGRAREGTCQICKIVFWGCSLKLRTELSLRTDSSGWIGDEGDVGRETDECAFSSLTPPDPDPPAAAATAAAAAAEPVSKHQHWLINN